MLKKLLTMATVLVLLVSTANAEDFYKGKTVKLVINLSAGGSTGVMAQLFSRYWSKHTADNPQFVVQPVAGGGQLKGIRHVLNARPDGLTLGWLAWGAATRRIGPKSQQVDWSKFDIIAGAGALGMAYVRKDVEPGINKAEDIAKAKGVKIGGYRPGSFLDLQARMTLELLGVDYTYTTGFKGGAKIVAALMRKEINFHSVPAANYFGRIDKNVVETGIGIPLWYYATTGANGNLTPNPAFGDIKPFHEVFKNITGKYPSGPVWKAMTWLNDGSAGVTWLVGAPRGTDDAKIAVLREGLVKASNDPDYLKEVKKITGLVPPMTDPDGMKRVIASLADADAEIVETLQKFIKSGTK